MACAELENQVLLLPVNSEANTKDLSNEVALSESCQVTELTDSNSINVDLPGTIPCEYNTVTSKTSRTHIDSNNSQPKAKRARKASHIYEDISYEISSYKCDKCGKDFKRESALKNHKLLNHESDSESGNESDMGEPKGFSRTLEDILAEKEESQEPKPKRRTGPQSKARKVKCTVDGCKQTFRSKSQLQKHLQKHLDQRIEMSPTAVQKQALNKVNYVQINDSPGTAFNSRFIIKNGLPETSVTRSIISPNESEKAFLHNYLQKNNMSPPKYEIRDNGLGMEQRFVCECCVADYNHTTIGKDGSMIAAQKIAIKQMILFLFENGILPAEEIPQNLVKEFPIDIQNSINLNKQNHNNNSYIRDDREQNTYLILTGFD